LNLPKIHKVILDIFLHFLLALAISFIIFIKSGKLAYAIIFLGGGVLIDLDHLIDYYFFFRHKFTLKNFLSCAFLRSGKAYLFLHSWEIVFVGLILGATLESIELLLFSLSLTLHLVIDNMQRKNLLCYFLIYRIAKKFEVRIILPEHN